MEKSLNLQMQEFEDGLINYINSSQLPIKAKLWCLKSVMPDILTALSKANIQLIEREKTVLNGKESNTVKNQE